MKRLLLTAAAVIGLCGTAAAWDGYYAGWGDLPYPGYSLYAREWIPYFAEHPPVYYSHAVARPYGYSPYAYPPTVLTPDTKVCAPRVVQNAYVVGSEVAAAAPHPQPLRVVNPYVTGEK